MYKNKYTKYKNKYLKLKMNQYGGDVVIKESDNLIFYSSEYLTQNKTKIYFCFERLDENNELFWRRYVEQARYRARFYGAFRKQAPRLSFPNKFTDDFGWDEETFNRFKSFIIEKQWNIGEKNPFAGIDGGITGFENVLNPGINVKYVSYFSKIPLTLPHSNKKVKNEATDDYYDINNGKDYEILFGHIIMSFMFITKNDFPFTTHFGIFKNPPYFFDLDNTYANLSMILHGFTAKTALTQFNNKKYMVNSPLMSMVNIMLKQLDNTAIHMGTNLDLSRIELLEDEDQMLLKQCPPLIYIDHKGIWSVAKKGTDLSQYPYELPKELIEYSSNTANKSFNLGGNTIGSLLSMVDLPALANIVYL
jgi:hypothetical protein